MRRYLLALVAWSAVVLLAWAWSAPEAEGQPTPVTQRAVQRLEVTIAAGDPLQAGRAFRQAAEEGNAIIYLRSPLVDVGSQPVYFGPNVHVLGVAREATTIISSATSSAVACVFEANVGTVLERLTLDNQSRLGPGQQSQVFGFAANAANGAPRNAPNDAVARLHEVNVLGRSFGVYLWAGQRNRINLDDVFVAVGRWAVCQGVSSGVDAGTISLTNGCRLLADYDRWPAAGGEIGAGSVGLVCRGGGAGKGIVMRGGTIECYGSAALDSIGRPAITTVVGAWTTDQGSTFAGGTEWPAIEMHDVACRVQASGTNIGGPGAVVADVWQEIGVVNPIGGSGSGVAGSWLRR